MEATIPRLGYLRNRLDLEMQGNDGDDEALQVLDQIVERAQSFGVLALLDIHHRVDCRALL